MKERIYRVEFITKKHGCRHWAIDIEADTRKEAMETAKAMWRRDIMLHIFRIYRMTAIELGNGEEPEYSFFKRIER